MSFKLFIYYCSLCGGWAAIAAWAIGRNLIRVGDEAIVLRAGLQALVLGVCLAFLLAFLDSLWSSGGRLRFEGVLRTLVAAIIGAGAGLLGGVVGQLIKGSDTVPNYLDVIGWFLTGTLVGVSIGVYDILDRLVRGQELRGAVRKLINGLIGGIAGGILGGVALVLISMTLGKLLKANMLQASPLSPAAIGFTILGMCVGFLIGLAQVILKEAWVRVESGFRPGREIVLSKPETSVGKHESCDIGLFGGQGIEKFHCKIQQHGANYYLADQGTPGGTWVNDQRVAAPVLLKSGDRIRLGNCLLVFRERAKR